MSKSFHKISSVILVVVLLLAVAPAAFALPAPNADAPYELILDSHYGSIALPGISYDLYFVADRTNYSYFSLAAPFDTYPPISADLNNMTAEEWNALATTLQGYVSLYEPAKAGAEVSDSSGLCSFTGLDAGLYLVVGHAKVIGGYNYTPKAAMIAVPAADEATDTWLSPMTVQMKISRVSDEAPGYTLSRHVLKVWNDDDSPERPSSVTVHLLENGVIYDTVILNSANNWRHTWNNLSSTSEWTLVEDSVEGYSVLVTLEGITFRVENKLIPPSPPDNPPDNPPDGDHEDSDGDDPPSGGRLPQTGALWWPVPILILVGALFLAFGMILKRKLNDDE